MWFVDQDHIRNPTVSLGDKVTAGMVLRNPRNYFLDYEDSSTLSDTLGRKEIMVFKETSSGSLA